MSLNYYPAKFFVQIILLNLFFSFNIVHSADAIIDDLNICDDKDQNNWFEICESKCCCDRDLLKNENYFKSYIFLQLNRNVKSRLSVKNKLIEENSQSPPKSLFFI